MAEQQNPQQPGRQAIQPTPAGQVGRQVLTPPDTAAPPASPQPTHAAGDPHPHDVPQQQIPAVAHSPTPLYGPDGRLTRAGMVAAINAGGSVLVNGRHIGKVADLPTSAELAQTDDEKAAARRQLEAQQRQIQEQLDSLGPVPTEQAKANAALKGK